MKNFTAEEMKLVDEWREELAQKEEQRNTEPRPYEVRRKRCHKGKMSDRGMLYLEVRYRANKHTYTSVQLIPGHLQPSTEQQIANMLFNALKAKYLF